MRRDLGLLLVSALFFIAASFCYLYTQRYTGDLPVISHPYRDYALPLAALGAVPLILGLYLWLRGEPKRASPQSFSPTASNLAFFIVAGLLVKIAAEVMHEVGGHGLYVLLLGGRILGVHISLLWPLQTSYIWWSLPNLEPLQRTLIIGGGILNCLIVSLALQLLLLLRSQPWRLGVPLLWFSYWNYLSSTGYLLSGGYGAFGDVAALIEMGVLSRSSSLLLGLVIFAGGYFLISLILRRLLTPRVQESKLGYAVAGFWLITPLVVALTALNPCVRAPLSLIPVGFIPSLLWLALEMLWKRK